MRPPEIVDVRDRHNGFTAITKHGTLWRPADVLARYGYIGKLVHYREGAFYQTEENVTEALYKVKGYPYLIATWWREDGTRIA